MHGGKKTVRLWLPKKLCFDPFMACRLRDRAEKNCRKLEDEIRFLIMTALDDAERKESNGPNAALSGMEGQR